MISKGDIIIAHNVLGWDKKAFGQDFSKLSNIKCSLRDTEGGAVCGHCFQLLTPVDYCKNNSKAGKLFISSAR
jgi:hypothetical protein